MQTKRTFSRLLSILLVFAMLLPGTGGMAHASGRITATDINPEYAHLNVDLTLPKPGVGTMAQSSTTVSSMEEASAYLCEQMEQRVDTITVKISGYDCGGSEAVIKADWKTILHSAFAHTGDPTEGDYLERHYAGASGEMGWDGTFTYFVKYYTTAAQEEQMDAAVDELLAQWKSEYDIYNLSDYEKVCVIYDYICANVVYDYDNLNDSSYTLKYSAYAALINGTSVCQGYASLFYRLALALDVDTRYIKGDAGGPHGWNIVDMGDYYYYVDATWDAGDTIYSWFLCGSESFPDHTPYDEYLSEEFTAQYPIDKESYEHPSDSVVLSGDCGENIKWTLSRGGILTLSGEGAMPSYSSSADFPWRDHRTAVKSIIVGEGITKITALAFYSCKSAKQITIPASVTEIGWTAFGNCTSLETVYYGGTEEQWSAITIDATNTDLLAAKVVYGGETPEIPDDTVATGTCGENLTWVLSEDGTLTISGEGEMTDYSWEGAPWFAHGSKITTVVIEDGVTAIGEFAFEECTQLSKIVIPASLTVIGAAAFYNCHSLSLEEIPETVSYIGDSAFHGCDSLVNIVLPEGLTDINYAVFRRCTALESVTIPGSVNFIDAYAFEECTSLTGIVLPEGLSEIKFNTFYNCAALTSITIPNSVTAIGDEAFYGCEALETVYYGGTEAQWDAIAIDTNNDPLKNAEIIFADGGETPEIPEDAVASGTCGDNLTWVLTDDGTLTISGSGDMHDYEDVSETQWFKIRSAIQRVVVENGVTSIGEHAFDWCENLNSVTLSDTVTEIKYCAFSDCYNLESVTLSDSITAIGMYAFASCRSLTSIDLPNSLTSIEMRAFDNCAALTEIVIPNSVTYLGDYAFDGCTSLTSLSVPGSVGTVSYYAFANCTALEDVHIGDGVTLIDDFAFYSCTSLREITIPDTVQTIDYAAFRDCFNLSTVFYGGTQQQWDSIAINYSNEMLDSAAVLATPALTVTNNAATGKIVVTWSKVDDAEKYEVWRATSKNGTYTKLTTTTKTSVTNTSTTAGKTYYYKVRAIVGDVQGEFSEVVSRTCDLARPVVKTTNVASTGKIKISWNKVDGAVKYEVYRATSKNGKYTKLTTTTKTSVTNSKTEAGVTYYYKVKAIASNSAANSAASTAVGRTCDLARPVVTVKLSSKGKPVISWNKVSGAVKYEVWRATSKNGTYTKLTTTTKTSVTNSKAEAGVTYYYKVRAIAKTSAANSAYSAVAYIKAK